MPILIDTILLNRIVSINGRVFRAPTIRSIYKDIYEAKLIQYDSDLQIIEDKLKQVNKVDKDFHTTISLL